jgi:hypothetical protein
VKNVRKNNRQQNKDMFFAYSLFSFFSLLFSFVIAPSHSSFILNAETKALSLLYLKVNALIVPANSSFRVFILTFAPTRALTKAR